jgi:hypothetical protein
MITLWAAVVAVFSKNPDARFQPMLDDRGSFIKSQTNLETTELDALGATARGESRGGGVYGHESNLGPSRFGRHNGGSVASGFDSSSRLGETRGVRNYDAEWTPARRDGASPSPLLKYTR